MRGSEALKRLMLRRLGRGRRSCFAAGAALSTAAPGRCSWEDFALGGIHREPNDTPLCHIRLRSERRVRHVGRGNPEIAIRVQPHGYERRSSGCACGADGRRGRALCTADDDKARWESGDDENKREDSPHSHSLMRLQRQHDDRVVGASSFQRSTCCSQGRWPSPLEDRPHQAFMGPPNVGTT